MKSQSIEWSGLEISASKRKFVPADRLAQMHRIVARAFFALVPALAFMVGSVWLASSADLALYLQATLWATAFVFLGLAIDADWRVAYAAAATGIALFALTYLSARAGVEFALIASTLVAAWIAAALFRH